MKGDGVVIFGQRPNIEEVKNELLALNLPCYASIRGTDGSYAGKITEIAVNCDLVRIKAIQERLNGKKPIEILEEFTLKLKDITDVLQFPNPFRR